MTGPGALAWPVWMAVAVGCLTPALAEAGRRPFIWTWDTEVVPERGVELENWVTDRIYIKASDITHVWTAPVVGITDRLELALPLQWSHAQVKSGAQIDWYGAELRWRLCSPDPIESGGWGSLLRLGVHKAMSARDDLTFEANAIGSWDPCERWHTAVDIGITTDLQQKLWQLSYGAGVSAAVMQDLRLGAEVFGYTALYAAVPRQGATLAGPDIAWTHGRLWVTAGYLFGVTKFAAEGMFRMIWGIAF